MWPVGMETMQQPNPISYQVIHYDNDNDNDNECQPGPDRDVASNTNQTQGEPCRSK